MLLNLYVIAHVSPRCFWERNEQPRQSVYAPDVLKNYDRLVECCAESSHAGKPLSGKGPPGAGGAGQKLQA